MGAVALHINRNLSVTDTECSWAVPHLKREKNLNPIPCNDFKALSTVPPREELRSHFQDINRLNGAALSALWLLQPEPERNNNSTLPVVNPRDVIFSEDFINAPCKRTFLDEQLGIDWDTIKEVAELTKGQSLNPLWTEARDLRVTASNFGDVLALYRRRDALRPRASKSLLNRLYSPRNLDKVKSVEWGRSHEPVAVSQFTKEYLIEVAQTGIFLDECGYLGGSPDGLVGNDGVCEVKCPYTLRDKDLNEVLTPNAGHFIYRENGSWMYDINHKYYHQIQGEMCFSRRNFCAFIAWTPKSLVVIKILADPQWPVIHLPMLKEFYVDEFLPYVRSAEFDQQMNSSQHL